MQSYSENFSLVAERLSTATFPMFVGHGTKQTSLKRKCFRMFHEFIAKFTWKTQGKYRSRV